MPPKNSYVEGLSPVPKNVTVFGDRVVRVGPNPTWLVSLLLEITKRYTEERPYKDIGRTQPPMNQGDGPQGKPTRPTP